MTHAVTAQFYLQVNPLVLQLWNVQKLLHPRIEQLLFLSFAHLGWY